jgi:hypothetical protein
MKRAGYNARLVLMFYQMPSMMGRNRTIAVGRDLVSKDIMDEDWGR